MPHYDMIPVADLPPNIGKIYLVFKAQGWTWYGIATWFNITHSAVDKAIQKYRRGPRVHADGLHRKGRKCRRCGHPGHYAKSCVGSPMPIR